MFGLELWFVYAVFSAVTAGVYIFSTKVAVERGYDGVLFNTASSIVSAIVLIAVTGYIAGYEYLSGFVLLLVVINAIAYMVGSVVRYEAFKCIDTAIFYPLYKTISPIFAIAAGVFLFAEFFTAMEWLGLTLSLAVPLLLLSKKEDERQNNLHRGLWLLLVCCLLAALAAVALKYGTDATENVYMFAAATHIGLFFVGTAMMFRKKSLTDVMELSSEIIQVPYIGLVLLSGVLHAAGFILMVLALSVGTLSLVYTIQSLYILIPIVLSIIFYGEHWNARKIAAIILSIVALWFLQ